MQTTLLVVLMSHHQGFSYHAPCCLQDDIGLALCTSVRYGNSYAQLARPAHLPRTALAHACDLNCHNPDPKWLAAVGQPDQAVEAFCSLHSDASISYALASQCI